MHKLPTCVAGRGHTGHRSHKKLACPSYAAAALHQCKRGGLIKISAFLQLLGRAGVSAVMRGAEPISALGPCAERRQCDLINEAMRTAKGQTQIRRADQPAHQPVVQLINRSANTGQQQGPWHKRIRGLGLSSKIEELLPVATAAAAGAALQRPCSRGEPFRDLCSPSSSRWLAFQHLETSQKGQACSIVLMAQLWGIRASSE